MLTEIISGLWICDSKEVYNKEIYDDNLINIVINCTINYGYPEIPTIKRLRIPVSEKLEPNKDIYLLKINIDKILDYINEKIEENNILIFCYDGKIISPLIVALYMVKYGKLSLDNIRDIIRSKNNEICLDLNLSIFLK
mgnify:CR=1 FL=1|tara:strand:+ start:2805 stop:3221 length:417 start_codon:yes stop_codon:yes gene_type:complete